MSARSTPTAVGSNFSSPQKKTVQASKSSPHVTSDWVGASLLMAKAITASTEFLPFPYVRGVFGVVVTLLETVEKAKKNREDLKELCGDTLEIMKIVRDQISAHGDTAATKFKGLCEDLESCLKDVLDVVEHLQKAPKGFRDRVKEVVKLTSNTEKITGYQNRLRTLRSNFVLLATIDTNFHVQKLTMVPPNIPIAQMTQSINNCPPPSRIFHGRQVILDKMHEYFNQKLAKQHIFLLYGLGGAGKSQIALKFIEQSSCFSDIFLIDTSTWDTIETGLKNIAVIKAGSSSQDALRWLASQQNDWLLFFDNADDPKINLNPFFPQCKHGNILITSRNPGLCVYAGSHALISDKKCLRSAPADWVSKTAAASGDT
ncbi:hypothetical protein C8J57DRAFT_1352189 [Mycena rebaudengoi]|nr:hypothetical protein C8J57DRAFT_1352189 [Mycena rebaudengoi]